MVNKINEELEAYCASEYSKLLRVIVCEPKYMEIREIINETQKEFKDENIDRVLAMEQHTNFVKSLEHEGIEVINLPPQSAYPEQVFTRDIGFTLGNTVYVAEMATDIRQGEELILKTWLEKNDVPFFNLCRNRIEGGDVIIDGKTIYIGVSDRTDKKSIKNLQTLLSEYDIIPIPFIEKFLHLDCVFNVISPTEALIFPEALTKKELALLESRYDIIEVTKEEQFTLGTNVLSIGKRKVFSLPCNKKVNHKLRERGYSVIEVDISEIIKSGGSFRCCTMPLLRTTNKKTELA
ncbi:MULTISPECIES: dimethylarginine dimethylaminohydrolase family protein [Peribacillus]|uniref:dimethylarginine dimethylaminohydrolase family protein n=1 Tax=Peribacillus TaxID=2675229 RepID=UPI000AE6B524|nr:MULTISPECIES: dimethylarginine dimethylaminohydrolase family protein [Peribacillus]MBK5445413.1 dimethylarginine dimethylaminohydrolase family protein [Peribacillus sp. TH24]MBK5459865.1 dimethylarginine dimethylaminohydrolase family protein [Peribacillus sp. TH27]MBK5481678.1 dimethylarginine dimethylaminohydrolase family protein [Peribacillus sp. TH16]MBK5498054.1 dimethylarginine dimethylaminohydrolase family protein [Peribacillus sp. TH14]MCO0599106.1 dimethylarginine dimethylaminohydro